MNVVLWIVQIFLALHTAAGAIWKFSNPAAETMPSLGAIPHGLWISMGLVELLCALGLVIPFFFKRWSFLIPLSAAVIAVEMLAFCGLHLSSGDPNYGPMVYWIVVAAFCGFIIYGRRVLQPL